MRGGNGGSLAPSTELSAGHSVNYRERTAAPGTEMADSTRKQREREKTAEG